MKIAVTYENGNVFQHFGRTEAFKVYEVENGEILSAEVIGTDGAGHEALAGVLASKGIEALICGGMGEGAKAALEEAGIEVCSGAEGDADEAVKAFLKGELTSAGVNCDHHDEAEEAEEEEDEEGCGGNCGSCESGCGGGCGGCGGCGGERPVILEGKNAGKIVKVNYIGTFNDGTKFDSSYDRGEALEFICGTGMMIAGFDKAVVNMEVGEETDIHLMPEEAYGEADPRNIFEVEIAQLPGSENLEVGQQVYLSSTNGRPFRVKVTAKTETTITFDANHEMAGKELNFHIKLEEVR